MIYYKYSCGVEAETIFQSLVRYLIHCTHWLENLNDEFTYFIPFLENYPEDNVLNILLYEAKKSTCRIN